MILGAFPEEAALLLNRLHYIVSLPREYGGEAMIEGMMCSDRQTDGQTDRQTPAVTVRCVSVSLPAWCVYVRVHHGDAQDRK